MLSLLWEDTTSLCHLYLVVPIGKSNFQSDHHQRRRQYTLPFDNTACLARSDYTICSQWRCTIEIGGGKLQTSQTDKEIINSIAIYENAKDVTIL